MWAALEGNVALDVASGALVGVAALYKYQAGVVALAWPLLLVGERIVRQHVWDFAKVKSLPGRAVLAVATFGLFTLAVVFFRAASFEQAWSIIEGMATLGPSAPEALVPAGQRLLAVLFGVLIVASHIRNAQLRGWDWLDHRSVAWRTTSIAASLAAVIFSPGLNPAFLYFQF